MIKNSRGVNRRQFLFVEGKTILAFVPKGKKFTECNVFTEVTGSVNCKVCIELNVIKSQVQNIQSKSWKFWFRIKSASLPTSDCPLTSNHFSLLLELKQYLYQLVVLQFLLLVLNLFQFLLQFQFLVLFLLLVQYLLPTLFQYPL